MKAALSFLLLLAAAGRAQSSMAIDMLAAHNSARTRLHIAPLTWSDKLARHSQEWADTLLARKQFMHRKSNYGENLFEIGGASATPARVLEDWTSESQDYDYLSNHCRKVCGHYTQVIWSTTKQVGCGVARDSRHEIWVCNYDPPGNYVGKRPY